MFIALKKGNKEVVNLLQMKGATAVASHDKWAKMLCIVGYEGDLECLKLLKKCEVNLEISDYDLRHVGHLAACEGHYEVLEFLARETTFSFELQDRWGNCTFDEMKHKLSVAQKQKLYNMYYDSPQRQESSL